MKKIALAMIVKGSDDEAESLYKCLSNVHKGVDGIFITITHKKGEKTNKKVKEVAELYGATISEFEWVYDFAAARNFNFSQVPEEYDYILWCDADDMFRGIDKLPKIINDNQADVYVMNYLYAFDEYKEPIVVHMKTQVVKNDGCVEWVGKLHEDFKNNRELRSYFIEDVERLHMSNNERFESAKERNLEIAQKQLDEEPDDPRSYWNVGNSLKALGKNKEALEVFEKFLSTSQSDDEKYIVLLRMAEVYMQSGEYTKAREKSQYAIGLKPQYPDAYFTTGVIYFNEGKWLKAAEQYLTGLQKPIPSHDIIVYNPRDYDYTPMMNLAKCYFNLNRPDLALILLQGAQKIYPKNTHLANTIKDIEKEVKKFDEVSKIVAKLEKTKDKDVLKKELEKVPDEFKSHPSISFIRNKNFIKKKSSGKDIVYFCGYTEEEWTPETAKTKGIGGSEEAVIHLTKQWVDAGYNVTVYNNCGHKEQNFDGVVYKPFWMWNSRDKQDVTILWRTPRLLDYEINSDNIFVDLHDVIKPGEFTKQRLAKIDKVFVKSHFHKSLFPNIPEDKFVIVPNGIDSERFKKKLKRDMNLIINTSSPDRSIGSVAEIFPEIKKKHKKAKCEWAYGWNVFDVAHSDNEKMMQWKNDVLTKMEESGIVNHGRVGHEAIADMYLRANIFLYPSEFAEIDCISLTKAMASGAIPVTTDFSAMGEKSGYGGVFIHSDKTKDNWENVETDFGVKDKDMLSQFIVSTVDLLKNPPSEEAREKMREKVRQVYDWKNIAQTWMDSFIENKQ